MVSTVTAVTMAAVTNLEVSTLASGLVTIVLIMLLAVREIAVAAGPRGAPLARNLTVLIAPLLVLFAAVVVTRWVVLP